MTSLPACLLDCLPACVRLGWRRSIVRPSIDCCVLADLRQLWIDVFARIDMSVVLSLTESAGGITVLVGDPCLQRCCVDGIERLVHLPSTFWEGLSAPSASPDLRLNMLSDACARSGDVEAAEGWLHEAADAPPNEVTYRAVLNACAKAGDVRRATAYLAEMRREGWRPQAVAFNAVIEACAKAGRAEAAVEWFGNMRAEAPARSHRGPPGVLISGVARHLRSMVLVHASPCVCWLRDIRMRPWRRLW